MTVGLPSAVRMPVWFLTHGGGPMPLMSTDTFHTDMVAHWKTLAKTLPAKPSSILVVSGHYEETNPQVTTAANPELLYDYSNFPPETYEIKYGCPGNPKLAEKVISLLRKAGYKADGNSERGLDHGVFVPLKVIFKEADIPVIEVSLMTSLDPKDHIKMGEALAPLRDEGVLIVASGSSFHNFAGFNRNNPHAPPNRRSEEFDSWLKETLALGVYSPEDRKQKFGDWASSPSGRYAHPREEHLIPAHVALGSANGGRANVLWSGNMLGVATTSFAWE